MELPSLSVARSTSSLARSYCTGPKGNRSHRLPCASVLNYHQLDQIASLREETHAAVSDARSKLDVRMKRSKRVRVARLLWKSIARGGLAGHSARLSREPLLVVGRGGDLQFDEAQGDTSLMPQGTVAPSV